MAADVYADAFLRADAEENGVAPQPEEKEGTFNHSFRRAIERYGVYVSPKDLAQVIAAGNAKFLGFGKFGSGTEVYAVPVDVTEDDDLVWVNCCYAPPTNARHFQFGLVVTVLPPDWQPLPPHDTGDFRKKRGKRKKNFARDFRRVNADENDFDS